MPIRKPVVPPINPPTSLFQESPEEHPAMNKAENKIIAIKNREKNFLNIKNPPFEIKKIKK
jgi:hypothetical protein